MSQVRVTKSFKEDFETWAASRLRYGDFTQSEMDEFKGLLRQDMAPGPDLLRKGLEVIKEVGVAVPAMIDNYQDRVALWTSYFAACAADIRKGIAA